MRKKDILGASVVALGLSFWSMAQAQTEDVVVDLSVLDSLSPSSASEIAAQPLFPVVSKAKPVVKKTSTRKKAKVARKAAKKQEAAKVVSTAKVDVKAEESQVVAPTPVVPENIAPADVVAASVENEALIASETVNNEIRPVTEDEHIVVVDVEPVSPKQQAVSAQSEDVVDAVAEPINEESINTPVVEPAETKEIEPVVEQPAAEVAEPEAPKSVDVPEKVSNALFFENDVSDLTAAQQQQIDAIISSFDNPQQNKIAIFAYNLDDGVDTFKRKRLSLNRAVDVRSYLLQKGYKNFSIKVINVDSGSDKVNSVEITEMK